MKKLFIYAAVLAIFPVSNVMSQAQPNATGAKPPVNTGMQPPAGGTMQPPAGGTMQPPAGGTMQPPAGGTMQPPAGGTMQPPAGGTMQPPAGGTMKPPAGGTMQPPPGPLPVLTSCNINGMPGIMNVKDPKPLSPTPPTIQFIDMASNRQQQSLWNPSNVTQQGLKPSIACLNNQPTDITTMPQGVQCQMLTNNPAPTGGGAVLIVSCYSGTGGGGGQRPPNTTGTQQR
jgi:hypothetical protein